MLVVTKQNPKYIWWEVVILTRVEAQNCHKRQIWKLTLKKRTAAAQRNATFGLYCGFAGGSVAIVPRFPSSWSCSFYRRKEEGGGQIEQPRDYKRTQQNRGRKRSGSSLWGQHQFRTNQVSRADIERERAGRRGEGGVASWWCRWSGHLAIKM